jgi:quercetin dioxygenase-like cupin family protein
VGGDPNTGLAVNPGEGEFMRGPLGNDVTFIVRGAQTNGTLFALESVARPGDGPPLHVHTREEETIYVVEGDFRWQVADDLSAAAPGSFAFVPRGVAHTWQNMGDRQGRLLVTFAPAGMEGFFERLSLMTEFDLEEFRAAGAEHGTDVIGPPLAISDPL